MKGRINDERRDRHPSGLLAERTPGDSVARAIAPTSRKVDREQRASLRQVIYDITILIDEEGSRSDAESHTEF
jgi:hypothetical protein